MKVPPFYGQNHPYGIRSFADSKIRRRRNHKCKKEVGKASRGKARGTAAFLPKGGRRDQQACVLLWELLDVGEHSVEMGYLHPS